MPSVILVAQLSSRIIAKPPHKTQRPNQEKHRDSSVLAAFIYAGTTAVYPELVEGGPPTHLARAVPSAPRGKLSKIIRSTGGRPRF
jgi:hypothetical protein